MLFDPLAPMTLPEEEEAAEPIAASSPLEFLRAVYSDIRQPMHRRMRAAIAALPFEHPKLAVIATFSGGDGFAAKLEAAIARSGRFIDGKT